MIEVVKEYEVRVEQAAEGWIAQVRIEQADATSGIWPENCGPIIFRSVYEVSKERAVERVTLALKELVPHFRTKVVDKFTELS
jgi:hypothetical protein